MGCTVRCGTARSGFAPYDVEVAGERWNWVLFGTGCVRNIDWVVCVLAQRTVISRPLPSTS